MVAPKQDALLAQMRKGTLQYCVLALLADEERYGFDLVRALAETDGMVTSEGTIYPLLSRLRRDGLVETTWRESTAGPAAPLLPADEGRQGCARRLRRRMGPLPRRGRSLHGKEGTVMSATSDKLVERYLKHLEVELDDLPRDRRREIVDEISGHIARGAGRPRARDGGRRAEHPRRARRPGRDREPMRGSGSRSQPPPKRSDERAGLGGDRRTDHAARRRARSCPSSAGSIGVMSALDRRTSGTYAGQDHRNGLRSRRARAVRSCSGLSRSSAGGSWR